MIIRAFEDRLRCVTQNDHAAFAAELLALWQADGMPEHPRRGALLAAAREHDSGWQEVDSAPRARDDGQPHDFRSLPQALRRELWRRGVARAAKRPPETAWLIIQHAIALHRDRQDDPDWPPLVESWRAQRDALVSEVGLGAESIRADYRFIDLTDQLSLAICAGSRDPFEVEGIRVEPRTVGDTSAELGLAPSPLAGTTSFNIACRFIPRRRYVGDADLAIELASASWRSIRVRVGTAKDSGPT